MQMATQGRRFADVCEQAEPLCDANFQHSPTKSSNELSSKTRGKGGSTVAESGQQRPTQSTCELNIISALQGRKKQTRLARSALCTAGRKEG